MSAKSVELSAVALWRIVKHIPSEGVASGCLLGIDTAAGAVEVTNVFLHPAKGAADFQPTEDDAAGEYQGESLKLLKPANLDANIVGWFQSSSLASYVNEATAEIQFDYQTQNPNSVMIVAEKAANLRAFQLSPEYMLFHKTMRERRSQGPATLITGGPVRFNPATHSVFVPVTLTIKLSVLDEAFLFEQRAMIDSASSDLVTDQTALLTCLAETIEDLAIEQVRYAQLDTVSTGATRIRGEDEAKRVQSANDLILLVENAKCLCQQ